MVASLPELSLEQGAALALIGHGVTHGYAIASWFRPDGVVGAVRTVSRPAIYRELAALERAGMVVAREERAARQQVTRRLSLSPAGTKAAAAWIDAPVEHLRDVRDELVAKLLLRESFGMPTTAFVKRQRSRLAPLVEALVASTDDTVVASWRREQARAVVRFLDEYEGRGTPTSSAPDDGTILSARNQLRGTVVGVKHGGILSSVKIEVDGGQVMTSTITREASDQLRLAPGSIVTAVCKATDVMVAVQPPR